MKKAIIVGNGPNWNYYPLSKIDNFIINNLIKERMELILKEIKKIDLIFYKKLIIYYEKIDFLENNFEKAIDELDKIIEFKTQEIRKNDEFMKNLFTNAKKIIEAPYYNIKNIFQASVLFVLFSVLKIGELTYSENFKKFLSPFTIFTTNYDNNIEKLGLDVIHLHGNIKKNFIDLKDPKEDKEKIKLWNVNNEKVLMYLWDLPYFYNSSAIIESNYEIKKRIITNSSKASEQKQINENRELNFKNEYNKLKNFDEVYLYGLSLDNENGLIKELKKNNKNVFYYYRTDEEKKMAQRNGLCNDHIIKNPEIKF